MISLLGLAGEVGELLSEHKKHLRDGTAHILYQERIREELGDLLWYVASVAAMSGLELSDVAATNLAKIKERWGAWAQSGEIPRPLYDEGFPSEERFPLKFTVSLTETIEGNHVRVLMKWEGKQLGDELTDNAYEDDGYRYHDVFHLSYAAVLGWSPVIRKQLGRKRRSNAQVDEVEDGGRAAVIEEAVAALAFSYAKEHAFLEGVTQIDYRLLKTLQAVTAHLEVGNASLGDWERAVIISFNAWRQVLINRGGSLTVNLLERTLVYNSSFQDDGNRRGNEA